MQASSRRLLLPQKLAFYGTTTSSFPPPPSLSTTIFITVVNSFLLPNICVCWQLPSSPPPRGGRVEGMRDQPQVQLLGFSSPFPRQTCCFQPSFGGFGENECLKKNVPHKQFPSTINQQSLRAPPQRVRLGRGRSDTSRTPPPVSPAAVAKSSATPSGRPSLLGCGWSSSARTNWPRPPVQPRTAG